MTVGWKTAPRALWCMLISSVGAFAAPPVASHAPAPERFTDPRTLYLRTGAVDTRERPSLHLLPTVFEKDAPYILQLDGPMTPARRDLLNDAGVTLDDYLPQNAWLVRFEETQVDDLRALEFVTWVGRFDSAWKRCPDIGAMDFVTDDRIALRDAGRLRLVVRLFPGADAALATRALEQIGATWRDEQIRPTGAQIEIDIAADRLDRVSELEMVQFVGEAGEALPRNDSSAWIIQTNTLNNYRLWDMGLRGQNQVAGLIDWNLYVPHCAFNDPANPIGPQHRKIVSYYGGGTAFANHGTHVGGVLAGYDPALSSPAFRGMAYEARIAFTNNESPTVTTTNLFSRLEIHHNDGARVHSNSWGNNDIIYNAWARDIDDFSHTYEDDVVLVATINSQVMVRAPENAKNCIAVNAAQETPNQANRCWGGTGPTMDGRKKPDVYGPGCGSSSALNNTACSVSSNLGGTSYATPAVAGMCILTRQYFMEGFYPGGAASAADAWTPSGALLKAMIVNAAVDMTGIAGYFGFLEGWGRVRMDDALYFDGDTRKLYVEDVRHAQGLSTGQTATTTITVASLLEPLKITLVWHDAPASLNADPTPVNNLNLRVFDPNGVEYRGNVISGLESAAGGLFDALNNAEQVIRIEPVAGVWQIDVIGAAVNVGTQGYALVVTGDLIICDKGDVNQDGLLDGNDVPAFVDVVLNGGNSAEACASDMNSNGSPGFEDVDAFVAAVLGD